MPHHVVQAACGDVTEDRILVLGGDRSGLIVVADGVGGLDHGGEAAATVVEVAAAAWRESRLSGPDAVGFALREADALALARDGCGQTTAVVVVIRDGSLFGAGVGNSEAWLVTDQSYSELTRGQRARPLIGSGEAEPIAFRRPVPPGGVLLVASDGLFGRVPAWMACDLCRAAGPAGACDRLIRHAQLPGGRYSDDVSVVVYRPDPSDAADGEVAPPAPRTHRSPDFDIHPEA